MSFIKDILLLLDLVSLSGDRMDRKMPLKNQVMLYKESKQTLIGFLPSFYIKKGGNRGSIQISNKFYNQAV